MTNAPSTFDAHATEYDAARRRLIPPFDSFYGTAVEAVRIAGEAPERVLDLGAGTGMLSAKVHAAFPAAELTLLDGAPRMLEEARAALGTERASYVVADLEDPLPAGPWDAIVSALAIHHLADEAKRSLFARAHAGLRPGGVFVDAEQVIGPSERFTRLYAEWHESSARAAGSDDAEWEGAVGRMAHDRCATVADQLAWLRAAGFTEADCLFQDHRFAVLVAIR
jgi:tRNA (cmo5U34)-methyltransferase